MSQAHALQGHAYSDTPSVASKSSKRHFEHIEFSGAHEFHKVTIKRLIDHINLEYLVKPQ